MKFQVLSCFVLFVFGLVYRPTSAQANLYPFGEQTKTDFSLRHENDVSSGLLSTGRYPMKFFGQTFYQFCVNDNGVLSFENDYPDYEGAQPAFPIGPDEQRERILVAPFWANVDMTEGGYVYFGLNESSVYLIRAADQISHLGSGVDFEPEELVIVTYQDVPYYGKPDGIDLSNTFQCVLASNGSETFAIFLYERIDWTTGVESNGVPELGIGGTPAQVGFNSGDGWRSYSHYYSRDSNWIYNLVTESNIREPGIWVYRITHFDWV